MLGSILFISLFLICIGLAGHAILLVFRMVRAGGFRREEKVPKLRELSSKLFLYGAIMFVLYAFMDWLASQ
ncbi:hypothetical protein [Aneurinibacillus tyrosinisolvens]|uniref:hypothetical protein n=1 Tax=Aneurinibacillus tyrosinisolvens TaxID=1443435 RepID=UPI00063EE2E5|nr:hypothetical protein [Aneurinibacillus tyrosinisolvens]